MSASESIMASGHETVPHQQAEHMAASTSSANRPETLDNTEPSTHGTFRKSQFSLRMSAVGRRAEVILEA
jgi:hypothetical protein